MQKCSVGGNPCIMVQDPQGQSTSTLVHLSGSLDTEKRRNEIEQGNGIHFVNITVLATEDAFVM